MTVPRPGRILIATIVAGVGCLGAKAEDLSSYSGAGLYRAYCASCHGVDAQGDGPVASSLKVEVPDLTGIARRQRGQFPTDRIRKIIDGRMTVPPHGTREMPVWGQAFRAAGAPQSQDETQVQHLIDLLVAYLQSIQRE